MTNKQVCEVCTENESKYKCPACLLKYCSLLCYKKHKEACKDTKDKTEQSKKSEEDTNVIHSDEQTEDRVSVEKLEELEHSVPLRQMLENPHLRTILQDLAKSKNPAKQMEKFMHEPLFLEFADECLQTVEPSEPDVEMDSD
ncbi:zinc finger HIT domain-containing protein 3-like isoform X3 [Mytilus californianus]|uniref:zinc finger HIT domain-containing protein 3-like isoform X3 n=1 Tax=Mytilus californianus TaxID=6549 RepID=UPI0022487297|nr:zinc finger HIT domain-containing protein 3-like isoform X3 [Mytilus californianus]